MCETFVLGTNVVPQEGRNNADYWLRLEDLARSALVPRHGCIWVASGPLWLAAPVSEDPEPHLSRHRRPGLKRYLNHEVLNGNVHVPTHLFKAYMVQVPDQPDHYLFAAFVVPNAPIDGHTPIEVFEVTRDRLRELAGFELLPYASRVDRLSVAEHFMSEDQYQTYWMKRNLGWARSIKDLEKAWDPKKADEEAVAQYERKKKELVSKQ